MSAIEETLRCLLDAIHEGRFVPLDVASKGYCQSVVDAAEYALTGGSGPVRLPDAIAVRMAEGPYQCSMSGRLVERLYHLPEGLDNIDLFAGPQACTSEQADRLRKEALEIFDGPECAQVVRDAIEWLYSSLLAEAKTSKGKA